MPSIRYAALAILLAVFGLVSAQEQASRPATSAEATSQDDAAAPPPSDAGPAEAAAADADDAVAVDSDVTTTAADADDAAAPGSRASKKAEAAPATVPVNRKPAPATGSPQRFEPTEKVRPDFDVAFPVDI